MTVFCKSERLWWVFCLPNPYLKRKRPLRSRTEKSFLMELLNLGHAEPFWVFERGVVPENDLDRFFEWKKFHSLTDKIVWTCENILNRIFFLKSEIFFLKKEEKEPARRSCSCAARRTDCSAASADSALPVAGSSLPSDCLSVQHHAALTRTALHCAQEPVVQDCCDSSLLLGAASRCT